MTKKVQKQLSIFDHVKLISQEMETDKNEDDEKKKKKGTCFFVVIVKDNM